MKKQNKNIAPSTKESVKLRLSEFFNTDCHLFVRFYHYKKEANIFQMTKIFFWYRGTLHEKFRLSPKNMVDTGINHIKMDIDTFKKTEKTLLNVLKFKIKQTSIENRKMFDGTRREDRQLTYIKKINVDNLVDEIFNVLHLYDTELLEHQTVIESIDDI